MNNTKKHKARLIAKEFTQTVGIDYTETFSPVSKKDFLCIVMALVSRFYFDLHKMDVKMTFLNGTLKIYIKQYEGFSSCEGEHLVCKLNKSNHGLKQASHQRYLKFHEVITSFGFEEDIMDL